jgi:hypothetical protein
MNEIQRSPGEIAIEINSIKNQTRNMVLYNSIEIGRRLSEAKLLVSHGEWGEWLKKSVDYSQRTASNLMRIFDEYGASQITLLGDNSKSQAFANLGYSQAVALLGVPESEREQFIAENDVNSMTTRELQEAIKAKKDAETRAEGLANDLEMAKTENKQLSADLAKEKKIAKSEVKRLSQLESDLAEAQGKVQELTAEINKPVTLEPAVIEKIPEEVEQELTQLRAKVGQQTNPGIIKYSVCFDSLVSGFKTLLAALAEIKETDTDEHEKYKNAVLGLIGKMSEKLAG